MHERVQPHAICPADSSAPCRKLLNLLHIHRHLRRVEHLAVRHAELLDLPYAHATAVAHRRGHSFDGVAFIYRQQMRGSELQAQCMRNRRVSMCRNAFTCSVLGQLGADTAMNHAMRLQHICRHRRVHDIALRGIFDDFNMQDVSQAHEAPLSGNKRIAMLHILAQPQMRCSPQLVVSDQIRPSPTSPAFARFAN